MEDTSYVLALSTAARKAHGDKFTHIDGRNNKLDSHSASFCNDNVANPCAYMTFLPSVGKMCVVLGVDIPRWREIDYDYGDEYDALRTWVKD